MIVEPLIGKVRGVPARTRFPMGALTTALLVSFGMVWIARLTNVDIGTALPGTLGAMGAALYMARTPTESRRRIRRRAPDRLP